MNLLAVFCYITMMCDSPLFKRLEQPATIANRIGQATIAPKFGQPTIASRLGLPTIAPQVGQAANAPQVGQPAIAPQGGQPAIALRFGLPTIAPQVGQAAITPRIGQSFQNVNNSVSPTTDGRKTTRETSSYPTRYDFIDIEAVMNNERIIKILFNCVMNQGPCTREGLELKSKLLIIYEYRFFIQYLLIFNCTYKLYKVDK